MEKITISKAEVEYYLIRKKNMKRIILKIKDNKIMVSAPYLIPIKNINQFVLNSKEQIEIIKEHKKKHVKVEYIDGGIFKYLGNVYIINLVNNNCCHAEIINDKLFVYHSDIEKTIKHFMKKELYKIVISLVEKYSLKIKDQVALAPTVIIKDLSSMYGVCYFNKNKIGISTMMIHEPFWVIEYVVVHELIHFVHQNHSKLFYQAVFEQFPLYKEAIQYLKQGGS